MPRTGFIIDHIIQRFLASLTTLYWPSTLKNIKKRPKRTLQDTNSIKALLNIMQGNYFGQFNAYFIIRANLVQI